MERQELNTFVLSSSMVSMGSKLQDWPSTLEGLGFDVTAAFAESEEADYLKTFKIDVPPTKGGLTMTRTKSVFSILSLSSSVCSSTSTCSSDSDSLPHDADPLHFARVVFEHTQGAQHIPTFDASLRKAMEPTLRRIREKREKIQVRRDMHASIAGSLGVPYTCLRRERPFLFDTHTFPLHDILAQALQVQDLSRMHELSAAEDPESLLAPLLDSSRRLPFHEAYDNFVTSFCIPLLHEQAINKKLILSSFSDCIVYRYQAFPTIRVHLPGEKDFHMSEPSFDVLNGHSIGCLKFHVPLTASFGTNALYTESYPGREDWHPLQTKSVGLGYLFDGARCIHFDLENTTEATRVSLEFRVLMHSGNPNDDADVFTPPDLVEDAYSRGGPGYYDEACIDWRNTSRSFNLVVKKKPKSKGNLYKPDPRSGPPFERR